MNGTCEVGVNTTFKKRFELLVQRGTLLSKHGSDNESVRDW